MTEEMAGGGGGLCLKEWMFQEAKQKLFQMKGPEITTNKMRVNNGEFFAWNLEV